MGTVAAGVALLAIKGMVTGRLPLSGLTRLTARLAGKGMRRSFNPPVFTGADAGYARIPGAAQHKGQDDPGLKVMVSASGTITVDGREATIAELEQRLAGLKTSGGTVWCYCEPAQQEPPQASQVLDCILRAAVPFTLSSSLDPSDGPRQEGRWRPGPR